jgi:hypothetical protein
MKKAARKVTSIDFSMYRARKNPYAKRIKREGIELVHDGPSAESLEEIPELGPTKAYVLRARKIPRTVSSRVVHAIKVDDLTWNKMAKRAAEQNMPIETWIRRLIAAVV